MAVENAGGVKPCQHTQGLQQLAAGAVKCLELADKVQQRCMLQLREPGSGAVVNVQRQFFQQVRIAARLFTAGLLLRPP